jgi:hypothetical protein
MDPLVFTRVVELGLPLGMLGDTVVVSEPTWLIVGVTVVTEVETETDVEIDGVKDVEVEVELTDSTLLVHAQSEASFYMTELTCSIIQTGVGAGRQQSGA